MMFNETSMLPIAFDQLNVPPYQRKLSQRLIDTILERWDPRMVRPLLVCSESINIIDGRHTRVALEQKGYSHSLAQFISCKDLEEEMHVFNVANMTRKMLTAYDMHHAWLSIKDRVALEVQKIAELQYKHSIRKRDDNGLLISGKIPWATIRSLVINYPSSYQVLTQNTILKASRDVVSEKYKLVAAVEEAHKKGRPSMAA